MKRIVTLGTVLALALTMALPASAASDAEIPEATIVDIVLVDDGEFDVLQAAVIEAGLVEALSADQPKLRVFAPTDAAFVSTFEGLLGTSLTEADVISFIEAGGVDDALGAGALVDILLYHVTDGHRRDVLSQRSYWTLNGDKVTRHQLIEAGVGENIYASNGIINVLTNNVLIP